MSPVAAPPPKRYPAPSCDPPRNGTRSAARAVAADHRRDRSERSRHLRLTRPDLGELASERRQLSPGSSRALSQKARPTLAAGDVDDELGPDAGASYPLKRAPAAGLPRWQSRSAARRLRSIADDRMVAVAMARQEVGQKLRSSGRSCSLSVGLLRSVGRYGKVRGVAAGHDQSPDRSGERAERRAARQAIGDYHEAPAASAARSGHRRFRSVGYRGDRRV